MSPNSICGPVAQRSQRNEKEQLARRETWEDYSYSARRLSGHIRGHRLEIEDATGQFTRSKGVSNKPKASLCCTAVQTTGKAVKALSISSNPRVHQQTPCLQKNPQEGSYHFQLQHYLVTLEIETSPEFWPLPSVILGHCAPPRSLHLPSVSSVGLPPVMVGDLRYKSF